MSTSRKLVFTLVTVVATLLIAEVGARVVIVLLGPGEAPLAVGLGKGRLFRSDPELFWRLHPNLRVEQASDRLFDVLTNAIGFRGPELRPEKSPGMVRILAVGDSCTFGSGARTDESYPAQLANALRALRPDLDVETINAGVPGYSSFQTRRYLEIEGLDLEPDFVLIATGFNDTSEARPSKRRAFAEGLALSDAEFARALRRSNRIGLLRLAYRLQGAATGAAKSIGPISKTRVSPDEYRETLTRMVERTRAKGGLPILVVWPIRTQATPRPVSGRAATIVEYQQVAREVAVRADVPLVDGVAALTGRDDLFFDFVHLVPEGHGLMARAAAEVLVEHPPSAE